MTSPTTPRPDDPAAPPTSSDPGEPITGTTAPEEASLTSEEEPSPLEDGGETPKSSIRHVR